MKYAFDNFNDFYEAFLPYVIGFDMFIRLVDTKSAPQISLELFDLE